MVRINSRSKVIFIILQRATGYVPELVRYSDKISGLDPVLNRKDKTVDASHHTVHSIASCMYI